ncbi:MAG: MFS transporter, partial [Rhodospirillales bacterium]|nr:MFS transporter [Rhodospirillales bacterium]
MTGPTDIPSTGKLGVVAWALYDWANSAFPTVVITFVFATYFTQGIVQDHVAGTSLWGYTMSLSALAVALVTPLMGAIADQTGRRKPWLATFTALAIVSSALLWFAKPDMEFILWALIFAGLGNFAFESGMVFYNALLPDVARKDHLGRISGWAWGAGYAGGLVCLVIALVGFVQTDTP